MTQPDQPREVDAQGYQLATTAGPDPGNTDPEHLTAPLDPGDDVYALLADQQDQAELQNEDEQR
jgi:hypothetical protein